MADLRRVARQCWAGVATDHRENRPESARAWLVYLWEVWAAFGLFLRATTHAVLYSARHEAADVHPLEMEYGWTAGLAVERDATGRTPSHRDAATIQLVSGLFWAGALATLLSSHVGVPLAAAVAMAPSWAVLVGDPFAGVWRDLQQAYRADDDRSSNNTHSHS